MLERIREPLEHFINICNRYKNDEFDVLDFQHAIAYVYLPPETSQKFGIILHNAHEDLEGIIYGTVGMEDKYRDDRREHAVPLADKLIAATQAEIKRLENYKPYARPPGGQVTQQMPQAVNA
ncbi:MAG: hypothetical protein FWG68_01075 [Defluviitaleaceae bacterium]|nr:hypothetical protein [Defluviitaleaceae bacterium]